MPRTRQEDLHAPSRRLAGAVPLGLAALLALGQTATAAQPVQRDTDRPASAATGAGGDFSALGRSLVGGADPTVIKVGSLYVSAKAVDGGIAVRTASTAEGVATAPKHQVWRDTGNLGEVWAPEIVHHAGQYRIYFAAGRGAAHRMYHIGSATPTSGYSAAVKVSLPGDKWAIDGVPFTYNGQRWFVWSGWSGDTNVEQNLYIARMSSPTAATGGRYVISQPREPWERVVGNPYINEAPQPVVDPQGRLHVVYSANGSWSSKYCIADLRLRAGGDPTYVWDWYKSNGCLFGSHAPSMMSGWTPTVNVDGPGHQTFILPQGDVNEGPRRATASPRCTTRSPRAPRTPGPTATGIPGRRSGGAAPPTGAPTFPAAPPTWATA